MNIIGLDIGTTTVSAVVLDSETGKILEGVTLPNDSAIKCENPWSYAQNADRILEICRNIVSSLKAKYTPIKAIGVDGQMHGMVYLDGEGRACSPLYTWQDKRGDLPFEDGTYASVLSRDSGIHMASGFGLTTHYWFIKNDAVFPAASVLCTIADYVAMHLAGRKTPLVHTSNAASMGLFDIKAENWAFDAMEKAGFPTDMLPEITAKCEVIGTDEDGIPVSCAIGDNQASFIGSVKNPECSVLVNMGTGGQVSMMADVQGKLHLTEQRPLNEGDSILVGSSLCGGRAYAILERFMRSCAALTGYEGGPVYEAMNKLGWENLARNDLMQVSPLFCGSRAYPDLRAAISGIDENNFDAGHLIAGTLLGMANELHENYQEMLSAGGKKAAVMIGSGNAIRKNPALKKAFEMVFGLDMQIPAHCEEAAYGAALFGYTAAGYAANLAEAENMIQYC